MSSMSLGLKKRDLNQYLIFMSACQWKGVEIHIFRLRDKIIEAKENYSIKYYTPLNHNDNRFQALIYSSQRQQTETKVS